MVKNFIKYMAAKDMKSFKLKAVWILWFLTNVAYTDTKV